jgi:hypothetical protein
MAVLLTIAATLQTVPVLSIMLPAANDIDQIRHLLVI